MKQFIYQAQQPDGQGVSGVQEASTAAEAMALLGDQGFTAIRLHNHVFAAAQPLETGGLNHQDYARQYLYFQNHSGWSAFLVAFIRQSWWVWLLALGLTGWLYVNGRQFWSLMPLAAPVLMLAWAAWKYRDAEAFNQLLRHIAYGEWSPAIRMCGVLRQRVRGESVHMELDIHRACSLARHGHREEAEQVLVTWQPVMDLLMPGMFVTHQARLSLALQDYPAVLAGHRQAMALSDGDASIALDYALMEARYGSPARAHCLLMDVSPQALPAFGDAFLPWVEGIVALRQGRVAMAVAYLQQAVSGMQVMAGNPAIWPTLAVAAGDLGLALLEEGDAARAATVIAPVWPVLSVHGDPSQLEALRQGVPSVV